MAAESVALASLDEDALDRFAARRGECACPGRKRYHCIHTVHGARLFLKLLQQRKVVTASTARLPEILERFEHWMRRHRGVVESTLVVYRRILLDLIEGAGEPAEYTAVAVRRFVSDRAARTGVKSAKLVVTAVRMFLRYLSTQGLCGPWMTAPLTSAFRAAASFTAM